MSIRMDAYVEVCAQNMMIDAMKRSGVVYSQKAIQMLLPQYRAFCRKRIRGLITLGIVGGGLALWYFFRKGR